MDTPKRLRRLAVIARIDKNGLPQFLKSECPDWIPANGPGVPNREYTRTRETRWRMVSVIVCKILTFREVSPTDIEGVAEMFESHTEPTVSHVAKTADCHEWHNDYFMVSELASMRKAVKLAASDSSMTRVISDEIKAGRIERDGNKSMRIRMDLYTEWTSKRGE